MRQKREVRTRIINIRLTQSELQAIEKGLASSTCRKRAEYARILLTNQPVTILHRNQSVDDLTTEIIRLKMELRLIGKDFAEMIEQLRRASTDQEIRSWLLINEQSKAMIFQMMNEIQKNIAQISLECISN